MKMGKGDTNKKKKKVPKSRQIEKIAKERVSEESSDTPKSYSKKPIETGGLAGIVSAYPPEVGDKQLSVDLANRTGQPPINFNTIAGFRIRAKDIKYRIAYLEVDKATIRFKLEGLANSIEALLLEKDGRSPIPESKLLIEDIKARSEGTRTLIQLYKLVYEMIGDEIKREKELLALEREAKKQKAEDDVIGYDEVEELTPEEEAKKERLKIRRGRNLDELKELEEALT